MKAGRKRLPKGQKLVRGLYWIRQAQKEAVKQEAKEASKAEKRKVTESEIVRELLTKGIE